MQWDMIDLARVGAIARRHRVEALIAAALPSDLIGGDVPMRETALPQPLVARARDAAFASLRLAQSACRLGSDLDAAGIDWISIKGPALAQLVYGSTALKLSRDFDILVASADFATVAALLADKGYQRVEPGPEVTADQLPTWMRYYKDCGWRHPVSGMLVEVHMG